MGMVSAMFHFQICLFTIFRLFKHGSRMIQNDVFWHSESASPIETRLFKLFYAYLSDKQLAQKLLTHPSFQYLTVGWSKQNSTQPPWIADAGKTLPNPTTRVPKWTGTIPKHLQDQILLVCGKLKIHMDRCFLKCKTHCSVARYPQNVPYLMTDTGRLKILSLRGDVVMSCYRLDGSLSARLQYCMW